MTVAPAISLLASEHPGAREAVIELENRYGRVAPEKADVLVVLGGDGFMLHTLHEHAELDLPVFGMRLGEVGFLMNRYAPEDLPERISAARAVTLNPLRMVCETKAGERFEALAFNEVSLLRQINQAAHVRIVVNGRERLERLVADGVLVATAAGSTAYNLSAHGPILPLGTEAVVLTPISPFRPRRWQGAILPAKAEIELEVLQPKRRPVSATADYDEVRDVSRVWVSLDRKIGPRLLFDPEHSLEERILKEQFLIPDG
ncbi:NAD kinase [Wenzhouxiangella limi]|uniref:NAD kinase n=1 Tax=Wenzhouxiangella limi TaxID=2707351 RepID=A0A845VDC4_9GAMM|nr:NAD kinase [Wenzhouxiangella limi]NDY95269.1 NAD kinase [Wenzhouxiangella limi]